MDDAIVRRKREPGCRARAEGEAVDRHHPVWRQIEEAFGEQLDALSPEDPFLSLMYEEALVIRRQSDAIKVQADQTTDLATLQLLLILMQETEQRAHLLLAHYQNACQVKHLTEQFPAS